MVRLCFARPLFFESPFMKQVKKEYWKPEMALAGGADGMDLVRRFLHDAPAHLSAHGIVVLEVGNERAAFEAAFPHLPAIWLETELHAEGVCVLLADDLRLAFAPGAGA